MESLFYGDELAGEVDFSGTVESALKSVGKTRFGDVIYEFEISCSRKSGVQDVIICRVHEKKLDFSFAVGDRVVVHGELCSTFRPNRERPRLLIYAWVEDIEKASDYEDDYNFVRLNCTICKPPVFRETPMGKKITDFMVAVNGKFFPSYIPCIAWGSISLFVAAAPVGTKITVFGRLQSREYPKIQENGDIALYTVREVSVSDFENMMIPEEGTNDDC